MFFEYYEKSIFTNPAGGIIMLRQTLKGVWQTIIMIKKLLTLTVAFDNILGLQKYKKETKVPKEKICVLGISKL